MGAIRRQARWDRCESASARLSREHGKIWNGQNCGLLLRSPKSFQDG